MSTSQPAGMWKNQDERSKDETKKLQTRSPLWSVSHKMTPGCQKGWGCNLWLSNHTPAETYKNGDYPRKISRELAFSVLVVQLLSHVWLCHPMDCSTPGFPVSHNLWKFVQVHVHWIGDAIQPSHPLSPSSPSACSLSQHQGKSGGQLLITPERMTWQGQVETVHLLLFN